MHIMDFLKQKKASLRLASVRFEVGVELCARLELQDVVTHGFTGVVGQTVAAAIVASETVDVGVLVTGGGGGRAPYPSPYQPPPFKLKLVREMRRFAVSLPHEGQSLMGSSEIR
jgi:hypothetical protein